MKSIRLNAVSLFMCVIIICFSNFNVFGQIHEKKGIISKNTPDYKNPRLPIEERVSNLLSRMTVKEKVFQLASQYPNANFRLRIPNLVAGECLHGAVGDSATCFPQAIALASTWDTKLVERIATVSAKECRALGIHQCFAPVLAVVRDPRWGRTEENYGEDSFLVSRIGVAFINGLQGKGEKRFDKDHIIATAKHFVADGEPTAGDNGAAMDLSERTLREVHLLPFKAAVQEAKVGSIMPAHHSLNGVPCHANKHILIDILRKEYGFDGLVVSDNRDIRQLYDIFHFAESMQAAEKLSLEAQIDQELAMGEPWINRRAYGPPLLKSLEEGKIPIEYIDKAVSRVLKAKFMLGLFDNGIPVDPKMDMLKTINDIETGRGGKADIEIKTKLRPSGTPRKGFKRIIKSKEHDLLALEAARKALILLKNEGNLLPLDKLKLKRIAVIGPNANEVRIGGYSTRRPKYFVTVLEGIKKFLGKDVEVLYEEGCSLYNNSTENIGNAVEATKKSDVSILVVGGSERTCRENEDRDDLNLVGAQQELIKAVVATDKPVVVVLIHGRPLSITWTAENVPAILDGWYLGQECGTAIAEALFGEINPGGKLTMTFPRNVGQVPCYYNKLPTGRRRRLFQSSHEPLFPFGYGKSYTTFEFSEPEISSSQILKGDTAIVSVDITNTGNRQGDEVVQLYIHGISRTVIRPIKELKGFERISLKPGQTKKIFFTISTKELQFWNNGKWIVESCNFEIMVGPNSVDLKTVKLKVIG